MGLLGDLYSTIDSKKRQLRGLLSDPLETLYQGVRNFGAEQQGLLDLQARAYPWTGTDRTAAPDLAARKALADAGAAQGMAAATVWHGSPHKFDKFDASKIGTGEGAQAYGHGLYFAESPDVARGYKNALSPGAGIGDDDTIVRALKTHGGDPIAAAKDLEQRAQYANIPGGKEKLLSLSEKLKAGYDPSGSLYKVDLPDEHIAKMLDWDNAVPESQRAPISQAALKQFGSGSTGTSGELLYKEVVKEFERAGHAAPKDAATEWLRSHGVTGIRYLDGGSRSAGQGSSNFVVFPGNEGLLSILERNGKPIK